MSFASSFGLVRNAAVFVIMSKRMFLFVEPSVIMGVPLTLQSFVWKEQVDLSVVASQGGFSLESYSCSFAL